MRSIEGMLKTVVGAAGVAWMITEAIGRYFDLGKYKPIVAAVITEAAGVSAKLWAGGFQDWSWPGLIVALLVAGLGAGAVDKRALLAPLGIQIPMRISNPKTYMIKRTPVLDLTGYRRKADPTQKNGEKPIAEIQPSKPWPRKTQKGE
jgi:hypothetical protein